MYISTKLAPNWPHPVSNKIMSWFSEATEWNHKSCSQSMLRGENFDLIQHPEPTFLPSMEQKDHDMTGNWTQGILSQGKGLLSRKIQYWSPITILYHKWPSSQALQWKPALPVLPHLNLLALNHESLTESQIRETDFSPAAPSPCWLTSK